MAACNKLQAPLGTSLKSLIKALFSRSKLKIKDQERLSTTRKTLVDSAGMRKNKVFVLLGIALSCTATTSVALAKSSSNYQLPWQSVSADGGSRSSSNYARSDTVGQSSAPGLSESTNYWLGSGYRYGAAVTSVITADITLATGWNMFSLPLELDPAAWADQFSGIDPLTTFWGFGYYIGETYYAGYKDTPPPALGDGYWVLAYEECQLVIPSPGD